MEKIVAGFDGSEPAVRAVQLAADIAEKFGARLVLVYAVPPVAFPPEAYAAGALEIDRAHKAAALGMLEERARALQRPGVSVEVRVLEGGGVAQRIAEFAQEAGAGMLVVGTQGKGAVSRALAGSVSTRLVHISHLPVLVVR